MVSVVSNVKKKITDTLGNVIGDIVTSPLELFEPSQVIAGNGYIGFILFWISVVIVVIFVVMDTAYNNILTDILSENIVPLVRLGGILVYTVSIVFITTVVCSRAKAYAATGDLMNLLVLPPLLYKRKVGAFETKNYDNHPYYATGANESNNNKVESDNYLPELI